MHRVIPVLSKGMLILGGLLILAGLGWGIWMRLNAPPPPAISEAGAVVLAMTAPGEPAVRTPTRVSLPTAAATVTTHPARTPTTAGPTPALLPEWEAPEFLPEPKPTVPSPTPLLPMPSPTPVPARPPMAQNPPTRVVAPAIGLDARVVPMGWVMVDRHGTMVSEWVVPKKAAGWHITSALPGHGDNVVLSGHHNIEGKVFRYVVDLNPGDEITLYADDVPYVYVVTEKYILKEAGMPLRVRQKNAQWILPTGEERLTLVTCWPYEWPGNSHRVIVVARSADSLRSPTIDNSQ